MSDSHGTLKLEFILQLGLGLLFYPKIFEIFSNVLTYYNIKENEP